MDFFFFFKWKGKKKKKRETDKEIGTFNRVWSYYNSPTQPPSQLGWQLFTTVTSVLFRTWAFPGTPAPRSSTLLPVPPWVNQEWNSEVSKTDFSPQGLELTCFIEMMIQASHLTDESWQNQLVINPTNIHIIGGKKHGKIILSSGKTQTCQFIKTCFILNFLEFLVLQKSEVKVY